MKLRGIYAITDNSLTPGSALLTAAAQGLEGGISLLQYRDKSSDHHRRLAQASALQALCAEFNVPLIINDDIQLCLAAGATGVHLGQSDSSVSAAREILGPDAIIGITCHADIDLAEKAEREGASYVAFGRFFPSTTKPNAPPADLQVLTRAREKLSLPIAAIGGINADNASQAIAAGADLLAVINYLFSSQDVVNRAKQLGDLFKQAG
jgi:thiamine-phosphate pyrophosphorylase